MLVSKPFPDTAFTPTGSMSLQGGGLAGIEYRRKSGIEI